jgi:hypothetical protein
MEDGTRGANSRNNKGTDASPTKQGRRGLRRACPGPGAASRLGATIWTTSGSNYPPRHPVQVISKKRAAVQSLSPTESVQHPPTSTNDLGRSGLGEPLASDLVEAKIQLAVRQAIASMGVPTHHTPSILLFGSVEGSMMTHDEMEAAHKAEGLRLAQARRKQAALRAEEARLREEKTRALRTCPRRRMSAVGDTPTSPKTPNITTWASPPPPEMQSVVRHQAAYQIGSSHGERSRCCFKPGMAQHQTSSMQEGSPMHSLPRLDLF